MNEIRKKVPNSYFQQVARLLKDGKHVRLKVLGDSMYPLIKGGEDEIEIMPIAELTGEIPLYSALFYQWEGKYMIHRYIRKTGEGLEMLGDGNLVRREKIKEDDVLGILKTIYREDKTIDCMNKSWLRKGKIWYRLLIFRRILLKLLKSPFFKTHF